MALLYAFDLLELNGDDLRQEPIEVRKATLASVLRKSRHGIRLNEHLETRKGSSFSSTPARCGLRYRLKAAVSAVLCATGRPQKPGRGVVSPTQ
jgi:hypothetical protein